MPRFAFKRDLLLPSADALCETLRERGLANAALSCLLPSTSDYSSLTTDTISHLYHYLFRTIVRFTIESTEVVNDDLATAELGYSQYLVDLKHGQLQNQLNPRWFGDCDTRRE